MTHRIALGEVVDINPPAPTSARTLRPQATVPFIAMADVSTDGSARYEHRRPVASVLQGYTSFSRGRFATSKDHSMLPPRMEEAADLFGPATGRDWIWFDRVSRASRGTAN